MKFTKLLSLPAVVSFTATGSKGFAATPTKKPNYCFDNVYYDLKDYDILRFRFEEKNTFEDVYVSLKGYNIKQNQLVFEQERQLTKKVRSAPFSIDMYNYLTSSGLRLELTIDNKAQSLDFYPDHESLLMDASINKDNPIRIDNVCLGLNHGTFFNSEKFDFTNLTEYFSKNESGALDLSEIHFEYSVANSFIYEEAYLEIVDYENLFPLINPGNQIKRIPININKQTYDIGFSIKSNMYVNSQTREMSDTPLDNYISTNEIYIPLNREEDFIKNDFRIIVNNCGFSHSSIAIPLGFYSSTQSLGYCYDSDFCVSGGIRE